MYIKSFFLSTIGNKKYNFYTYFFIKYATSIILLLTTRSLSVYSFYSRSFNPDHLKTSLRRFNWLLGFGFLNRFKIDDLTFDISTNLNIKDLKFIYRKLKENTTLSSRLIFDRLYIVARIVEYYARKRNIRNFNKYLNYFSKLYTEHIFDENSYNLKGKIKINKTKDKGSYKAKKLLSESLKDLSIIFKNDSTFLAFGTLLGIIRDKEILKHDLDIDIGYIYSGKKKFNLFRKLLNEFKNFDFLYDDSLVFYKVKNNKINLIELPALITLVHKNGTHVDVFICHNKKSIFNFYAKHFCWKNKEFTIKRININGDFFNIPSKPKRYLRENYGDWLKPKKDYNLIRDSKNLSFSNNLSSVVAYTISLYLNYPSLSLVHDKLRQEKILKKNMFNVNLFKS